MIDTLFDWLIDVDYSLLLSYHGNIFICRLYTMNNTYEFNNTIINWPLMITGYQALSLPLCFHDFTFD